MILPHRVSISEENGRVMNLLDTVAVLAGWRRVWADDASEDDPLAMDHITTIRTHSLLYLEKSAIDDRLPARSFIMPSLLAMF